MHSIVIPHFNQLDTLAQTVTQLLSQTHVPDEILIVDDGSTVPVPDFAPPVHVLRRPRHPRMYANQATCINLGVARAKGDQITLMCGNWTFPDTFCEYVQSRIQPGIIWCGVNAAQGSRQARDPQDADNGLQYHFHRDDWAKWEEQFDQIGGNHHILWWVRGRMQVGVQFWYDPDLRAKHHHPPFQDGVAIALNPLLSWFLYQALVQGTPTTVSVIGQPGEESELLYRRTDLVCGCAACVS